jgi:hypothetical protein
VLSTSRWAWPLGVAAVLLVALGLRLVGLKHGLPYVYDADENAHFVPRAVGMFGHGFNPHYFVNPPAYTYLVHLALTLRFGTREAVGNAMAVDRTAVFAVARLVTALLGTAAVGLLLLAGRRLLGRAGGLLAAALLAVAFLPVFYSHLALNDVPAQAAVCLALVGVAGVYRDGRMREYALAGVGIGLACATKYTAGIVVVCLLGAVAAAPTPDGPGRRFGGLVLAGVLALAAFLIANPYALLDFSAFRDGLEHQSEASGDVAGKLGLTQDNGVLYYLGTATWGLGWLPLAAAAGGAIGMLFRDRRLAAVLIPAPILFLLFMGGQERFFARWLLPVYPILCLLAAWAVLQLAPRWRVVAAAAAVLLVVQGVVFSLHSDVVLTRDDTRQLARDWMVAHVPIRSKVVIEPFLPAAWAADAESVTHGTGNGFRWNKWPTTRASDAAGGGIVRFEDYERTTRPALIGSYARGGYCWVVTGSTQYGRAEADPKQVPNAIAYYAALKRVGKLVYATRPADEPQPFSYDFSFNGYPLGYHRMGPEIRIYQLHGGKCA